jgi:protein-S-isoprenylcysteine O-methyltransferase Ste14
MAVYEKQVRRQQRRNILWKKAQTVLQSFSAGFSMIYYFLKSDPSLSSTVMTIRAILLFACAVCYACWVLARLQLGIGLTFIAKTNGPLITNGFYKYIRNPIYMFGTLTILLFLTASCYFKYLWCLVFIIPMQIVRSIVESNALRKKFGEQYEEYEKQLII